MHHDDPFGGVGEPGGEEDLLDEADAVGALEETFGEEPPSSAATSPLLLAPPVLPADDEAAVALMYDDEMLGALKPRCWSGYSGRQDPCSGRSLSAGSSQYLKSIKMWSHLVMNLSLSGSIDIS